MYANTVQIVKRDRTTTHLKAGNKESFGQWLVAKRKEKGWSQRELARRAGISNNYISALEKDFSPSAKSQKARPRLDKVDAIGRALELSVAEARRAAGYLPEEELSADGFEKSEFALLYSEVEKLTPQQKRDFKIAWEMAKDALKRIKKD